MITNLGVNEPITFLYNCFSDRFQLDMYECKGYKSDANESIVSR